MKSFFKPLLDALVRRDEFLPFRINLLNGDRHNVAYPAVAAMLDNGVYLAFQDGHWAEFPYQAIASIESLITIE